MITREYAPTLCREQSGFSPILRGHFALAPRRVGAACTEAAGEQKKKEVDRKASKARKIRYVVHDKILNFMSAMQNHQLEEGRDAIVSNLFGVGVGKRPVEMVRQVKAGDVKLI